MAKANLTKEANIQARQREIDFVTQFQRNWEHLRDIMGVTRMIRKNPGETLRYKYAEVVLANGAVAEGEEIPYSQASVKTKEYDSIVVNKWSKGVSLEAINEHGYDDAVGMTDDEMVYMLTSSVTDKFYTFLKTGTLISAKTTFQAALADAQAQVRNKWKAMHRSLTEVVGFCNILDAYDYLGAANITVQTAFGMTYIENFLGYSRPFLSSYIPSGKVVALPVENLILYYINPADTDFARAGLNFRVDGETPLLGFHVDGNYNTLVSESTALMGMVLFAEYLDGIAVVDIGTETYTAVSSPSGNPSALGYFEKAADNTYFPSTDTTVVSGKTYYTRSLAGA